MPYIRWTLGGNWNGLHHDGSFHLRYFSVSDVALFKQANTETSKHGFCREIFLFIS